MCRVQQMLALLLASLNKLDKKGLCFLSVEREALRFSSLEILYGKKGKL